MFYRTLTFFLLLVTWVFLSGQIDGFHLTLGVLSSGFVTWISGDLLFNDRESGFIARLKQGGRLANYLIWMLWQIVLANVHLLGLAFGPRKKLQPSIICFRTSLQTDFEKFLLAADGSVISRFRPGVEPQDPRLVTAIEQVVGA